MLSSFAKPDKTNEQLKGDKNQTARDRDPRTLETKRAVPTAGVEEAKTEYTAAATAVTSNTKSRAAFESQSSDRIAKSDGAEETMSTMVKLTKDPLEPHDIDQHTEECHLMGWPYERKLVTQGCELRPVQGRAEDTDECVKRPHTEMCEKSEVTSVEEGRDSLCRRVMRLRVF